MENREEKEIKVCKWKVHRAITPFGLGGSTVILEAIMKILEELEHVDDTSSPIGTLFGRLCSTDRQDGEKQEQII